jgi:hypothetical protein
MIDAILLAFALAYMMLLLTTVVLRGRAKSRREKRSLPPRKPSTPRWSLINWPGEVWATGAIILIGGILSDVVLRWGKSSLWTHIIQFMFGGWPNDYAHDLSTGQVASGVLLQVIFGFGLPVLLVGLLYRGLARSVTMRVADFLTARDKIVVTQIYFAYRKALLRHALGSDDINELAGDLVKEVELECWSLAHEAMARVKRNLDEKLPPETLHSLYETNVASPQDEEQFAYARGD